MSELNPHIVKEHEGDYENTIQHYVTGRPLDGEEMLPDSHGVHPVSPLGFMLRDDGAALVPAEPLSGFSSYGVFRDCPTCGGTGEVEDETTHTMVTCPACDGTGSLQYSAEEAFMESYRVAGKYYMFDSDVISFPVLDIHRGDDGTKIIVTVNGVLPPEDTTRVYFRNITTDDYTPTGLVGESAVFTPDSVSHSADAGTTELEIVTGIIFDGTVVEGKLAMCVATEKRFLTVEDPDSDTLSGIYIMGETEGEPIRKVFNWHGLQSGGQAPGAFTPCYSGNGYSGTEVERWVSEKVGGIVRHGCHPSSVEGDLRDAGGLVTWFTTCGNVDISGGAGRNSVIVPGFGLGHGYANSCTGKEKSMYRPGPDETVERKWLTFGYGSKHDAMQEVVGKAALPLDWPFTKSSEYADETLDNNITLIKEGVLYDDGVEHKVVGGLTGISRECHVCDGHGELQTEATCTSCGGTGTVREDGVLRPCRECGGTGESRVCPNCHGTGEEPDCMRCGGTGEIEDEATHIMVPCPDCGGAGFCGGHRYVMDKIHVCLYNDFKPSDDTHGHEAGTTVLKKTFINLATPITQKDGDTFEITVSLPTIGLDSAYSSDTSDSDMKNLSGYYAYVSQPRAYVVSGTWEFSDTRVNFVTKDLLEYDLAGTTFKDGDGNPLVDGTEVRVKFVFDACRNRKFPAVGILSAGKITIAEPLDIPEGLARRIKRSADSEGNIHGSICGAAYVEPNNGTLSTAIKTNLGLNAVRNIYGALGKDKGTSVEKALQQYNKLYTADTGSAERAHVLFDADGEPRKDQRQIVATVYPTATGTFPWALTHRRKLGFLDKLMTMDADAGTHGLFSRVYRMNRDILRSMSLENLLPEEYYPLNMHGDIEWLFDEELAERDRMSIIGAFVTVVESGGEPTCSDAQPVRRAIMAAKLLSADYRSARVSRMGSIGTSSKFIDYVTGANIRKDGSGLADYSDLGELVDVVAGNEYECMANAVRLRHLPVMLASAGDNPHTSEPLSPVLDAYPYIGENRDDHAYYRGNPYGYGEFDTTARAEEIPCEMASSTDTEIFGMSNSVVRACINAGIIVDPDHVSDLYRSAELHAVDFGDDLAAGNVLRPHIYRDGEGEDVSWMEAIDAFTKLISPDNIPVPQPGSYDDIFTAGDNDAQFPFIMADAYGYYKILNADIYGTVSDDFIATTMPTSDALAMFLKEYVPSYAARLAMRNWDSYRVKVVDGATEPGDTVYLTRMKWYDPDCDAASRGIYATDSFIVDDEFSDMNLNRIEFASPEEAVSLNCSVPPYTVKPDYSTLAPFATENDPYSVSYTRVFMKFVFSEDAGRWYCIDYRQAPVSYLSPLYGAKALDQRIDGKPLWVRPVCESPNWTDRIYHTYEEYQPFDINPELVNRVMEDKMLMVPYLPVSDGGLGLNAPANRNGTSTADAITNMPHANFWSVRDGLRPVTGATPFGDIPRYYKEDGVWKWGHAGGIMADAVLWGQYDYPAKGGAEYHLPDPDIPAADTSVQRLIYAKRNTYTRVMNTGDIQVGPNASKVFGISGGNGNE